MKDIKEAEERKRNKKLLNSKTFVGIIYPLILDFFTILLTIIIFYVNLNSSAKTDSLIENSKKTIVDTVSTLDKGLAAKIDSVLINQSDIKNYIQGRQKFDSLLNKKFEHVDSLKRS